MPEEVKRKTLTERLHAIQSELEPITKDATNPFFHSKYFDINGVIAVLRPLLVKHGVIALQPLGMTESGRMTIKTILTASDNKGDTIETETILPEQDKTKIESRYKETNQKTKIESDVIKTDDSSADVQKIGATITYFRRYALVSLFLLEGEDDDGNTATGREASPAKLPYQKNGQVLNVCKTCGGQFNPAVGKEWATECYPCYTKRTKT